MFLTDLTAKEPVESPNHLHPSSLNPSDTDEISVNKEENSDDSTPISGSCFHNQSPITRSRTEQDFTTSSAKRFGNSSFRGLSFNQGSNQNNIRSPLPTIPLK
ncbi:hypothetical protein Hanom_Chr13g01244291 [Helianthus anomalus]